VRRMIPGTLCLSRAARARHAYAEVSERTNNLVRGSFWGISFAAVLAISVLFGFLPITLWMALLLPLCPALSLEGAMEDERPAYVVPLWDSFATPTLAYLRIRSPLCIYR
jgi:hypothetical protein